MNVAESKCHHLIHIPNVSKRGRKLVLLVERICMHVPLILYLKYFIMVINCLIDYNTE